MIAALEDIALEAGAAILPLFRSGKFESSLKADQTPVSTADYLADKIIRQRLVQLLDIPILSEESDPDAKEAAPLASSGEVPRFWCIDPIDGTKEFLKGQPQFTVNIALIEAGVPVAGVIYAPALDHLCAGVLGQGLRFNRQPQGSFSWPDELTLVSSRQHPEAELEAFMQSEGYTQRLMVGSSLKFSYVALGLAHCYPRFRRLSIWDIAAGHALVQAVGCRVLSLETGQPFLYSFHEHCSPPFCVLAPGRELVASLLASGAQKKPLKAPSGG